MARLLQRFGSRETSRIGLTYAAISGIMFGITTAICKFLSVTFSMDPVQLAFYRFIGCVLLSALQTLRDRRNLWKFAIEWEENPQQDNVIWKWLNYRFGSCGSETKIRLILVSRGVLVAPAIALTFDSVRFIPLSEATVLLFASAFLTAILAEYLLNEPFPRRKWVAMIFASIGVVLISLKGQFDERVIGPKENQLRGCFEALGGATLVAFVYVLARCAKGVHESVQVFNYASVAAFALGVFALCSRRPWTLPPLDWYLLPFAAMIVCGFCGQLSVTRATRYHPSGEVSLTRSLFDLAASYLFQVFLFEKWPDGYGIAGSASLVVALLLLTWC